MFRRRCHADGHHDLADRLGAPGADLAEAHLAGGGERDPDPEDQLVVGERRGSIAGPEPIGRYLTLTPFRPEDEHGIRRQEHRQRVPRGRGVRDVAPERPAVLDLGRADRGGRLDQGRDVLAA